jgi:GNAT superfamily N-acetyltransferase
VLSIEPLDPWDDGVLAELYAVYRESDRHGVRFPTTWTLEEMRVDLRTTSEFVRTVTVGARADGRLVGIAGIELALRDNLDQADVDVHVRPAWRRRGIGRRLAEHCAVLLRAEGRTTWNGWVPGREVDAPDGTTTPGEHLCRALGLRLGLLDVQRRLALPVPDAHLDRLAADAAAHHPGYELLQWVDRCPDEHVDAYCALKAAMNSQAPAGDLTLEDEHWDEARLRESEAVLGDSGRTRYACVARAPDGSLGGHNELVVAAHDPGAVYQWDTLVLPAHRGHRLGMALKVANLRTVQAAHPERTHVVTFNAASNAQMVAVNEAIGFRPVSYMGEWQGPVPA